mmetsp:Transcript_23528/g.50063  ORF Transcript_23528/g.50063 Transcript_23528/m.50063 type:complete len:298 (-) Transcript_23528:177-1070(-)|eukprot:CAMPEP_0201128502 /NCGR_PEP_ID=MMETSP0850-20130426/33905_1 /ASSEMBLY_ACC=CAM_ASM_000622 /TAXON_ID=183588 /ORGANISM="Pseudo-nitzschia fraudulenta, Strain WWA7" /LENGTH=297 /DNA_ID=CAMNT_0047397699 /DNA_START=211 /DNA_END=1107 /DNA_ORIENTATION=-
MVLLKLQRVVVLSSLLLVATSAFSTRKASQLAANNNKHTSSSSSLNVGAVWMDDDEQDGFLMSRASACADSESCSLEEAQTYLDDILHVQMDCIGGAAAATNSAICENVDVVSEVVANLRQKIETERRKIVPVRATVDLFNVALGVYVVSAILHGVAAVPNVPVDAPVFSSFDALPPGAFNGRGVTTILPVEWYWAIRDGYFPSLFSEWIRNGGLVVDVSAFDNKVVAFTPQEWVWSIQNGSFGHMLEENMRYGGLVVDSDFDTEGVTPMTAQDLLWSIQGGYAGTAVKHFFRNGGV